MGNTEIITVTLDGLEVSGIPGMNILELARESGVYIPTLCSDPHLTPVGACRICIVEDERNGALLASCVTPIASGMVINTRSPAVIQHRKNIVHLILASHPDTCMVCDKGNRCQLRQIASDLGIGLGNLYKIPQSYQVVDLNPFLERDLTKCILCSKCIRACQELVVEGAIDYFERGFVARPATFSRGPLEESECTFCGTCVAMCPTGALAEKDAIFRGTTSTTNDTICPYCSCGCSLVVDIKDNRIIRSRPGSQSSVNNGTACMLGSYALDYVSSPLRLNQPLVQIDGKLEPATWEQAIQAATQGFKKFMEINGSKSLAVLGSPKCPNEDNYVLQKFAWRVLGTSNIDNSSSLYSTSNFLLPSVSTGIFGATHMIDDLEHADLIMIAGSDLEITAPVLSYAVKRAVKYHGAKLLLIAAEENHLDYLASLRLKPLPGTEAVLLNCLSRVIVDQNLYDADYIVKKVKNFDEFQITLHGHLPGRIEAITGIPRDDLVRVAGFFASARRPLTLFGDDALSSSPDAAGQALINLLILTGNLQKGRGGFIPVLRDSNTLGSRDMGNLTGCLPRSMDIADLQVRKSLEEHPSINISVKSGLNVLDIFRNAGSIIKGLYIVGENPLGWRQHSALIQDALSKIEFLVVQDIFLSDTARLANVVLPACSTLEREGTFTNFEGLVQKFHPVIQPAPGCLPDWEIMVRMSQQMNIALDFNSLQDIRREIEEQVPIYKGYANLSRAAVKSLDTQPARHQYIEELFTGKYAFTTVQADTAKLPVIAVDKIVSEKKLTEFDTGIRTKQASRLNRTAAYSGWGE